MAPAFWHSIKKLAQITNKKNSHVVYNVYRLKSTNAFGQMHAQWQCAWWQLIWSSEPRNTMHTTYYECNLVGSKLKQKYSKSPNELGNYIRSMELERPSIGSFVRPSIHHANLATQLCTCGMGDFLNYTEGWLHELVKMNSKTDYYPLVISPKKNGIGNKAVSVDMWQEDHNCKTS